MMKSMAEGTRATAHRVGFGFVAGLFAVAVYFAAAHLVGTAPVLLSAVLLGFSAASLGTFLATWLRRDHR
jgi:hypothetical protein